MPQQESISRLAVWGLVDALGDGAWCEWDDLLELVDDVLPAGDRDTKNSALVALLADLPQIGYTVEREKQGLVLSYVRLVDLGLQR